MKTYAHFFLIAIVGSIIVSCNPQKPNTAKTISENQNDSCCCANQTCQNTNNQCGCGCAR
jgi:hypothetical protein